MITIQGSNLDLSVMMVVDNEFEFPLEHMVFESLQISASTKLHVPHGKLVIADREGIMTKFPLGDGHSFHIVVKFPENNDPDNPSEVTFKFRVFRIVSHLGIGVSYYTIFLVYDAPRFLYENMRSAIRGSSLVALKQIATDSKLDFVFNDGIEQESPDIQVWYPSGDKRCVFARKILAASWINDKSCMNMGVGFNGAVVVKNLAENAVAENQRYVFAKATVPVSDKEKLVGIKSAEPFSVSGVSNAMGGYKSSTIEQNPLLAKSSAQAKHDKVSASVMSDSVAVNKNINTEISGADVTFSPINCGNTHKNYEKALHQNKRLLGFYSTGFRVVTQEFVPDINLMDFVRMDLYQARIGENVRDESNSGLYVIDGISMFIKSNLQYYCKYELLRHGVNSIKEYKSQISSVS